MVRIDDVIDIFLKKRPGSDISRIQRAYIYSAQQHEGQLRKSGEPYMTHPLSVAGIIAEMGMDEASICAALLHDTIEDSATTRDSVALLFGKDIANIVDGVTKLSKVNFKRREERQAESFRKFLVAMSNDIRVLIIKLADRLHNMRTLEHMTEDSRERIAEETLDIYAPLADRLGISWLQADLDDMSFRYLEPGKYKELQKKIDKSKKARESYIQKTIKELTGSIEKVGFEVGVSGRQKNIYSIYKKMETKAVAYEDVYDTIAFRIICKSVPECYAILGLVHTKWVPVPGRFKDYIAMPKPNHYQSIHSTVIKDGERMEVQIRTKEMHHVAEYGVAAHWTYKGGAGLKSPVKDFSWMRELLESQTEVRDSHEFLETVKVDLFRDEVFVFTPRGDVRSLRRGATPLDFAYSIHTEVGQQCSGARVNGVQVPLKTELKNGDMVEIVTSKNQRPSPHWLDIVATSRARTKIRAYLRAEQREQSKQLGHELVEKGLRRLGCSYNKMVKNGDLTKVALDLKYGNVDNLVAAVGYGKVDVQEVLDRALPEEKREKPPAEVKESTFEKVIRRVTKPDGGGIVLDGLDNLLVHFARCCNPLPGESIIGYVSHGRGIVIHRSGCEKAAVLPPERRMQVQWSSKAVSARPVVLKLKTKNKPGVLAGVSLIFKNLKIDITSAQCEGDEHAHGTITLSFMVKNLTQLNHVVRELKQSSDVIQVHRI